MIKNLKITVEDKTYDVKVECLGDDASSAPAPAAQQASAPVPTGGTILPCPLSGKVVSIEVKVGDSVTEGDSIIILEAMKMNTVVNAPSSGTITAITVTQGDTVDEGQALLTIG